VSRELDRVLDDIDSLVDASLEGGEPRTGYDYGDPTYPSCPHCDRAWHGLPVTEKIAEMYDWTGWDDDYVVDEYDSPVLCPGSDFIGPARPRGKRSHANSGSMLAAFEEALRHGGPVTSLSAVPEGIYTHWTITDGQGNLVAQGQGTWEPPVGARGAEAVQTFVDEVVLDGASEARVRVHLDPNIPRGTIYLTP